MGKNTIPGDLILIRHGLILGRRRGRSVARVDSDGVSWFVTRPPPPTSARSPFKLLKRSRPRTPDRFRRRDRRVVGEGWSGTNSAPVCNLSCGDRGPPGSAESLPRWMSSTSWKTAGSHRRRVVSLVRSDSKLVQRLLCRSVSGAPRSSYRAL